MMTLLKSIMLPIPAAHLHGRQSLATLPMDTLWTDKADSPPYPNALRPLTQSPQQNKCCELVMYVAMRFAKRHVKQ